MTGLFLLIMPNINLHLRIIFMPKHFYENIKPHVEQEITLAKQARKQGDVSVEFTPLENAHVLLLALVMRIVGAATKTAIGFIPTGNTGGTNVSPFKVLPVSPRLKTIITKANSSTQTH
jgi:hypothetical protein